MKILVGYDGSAGAEAALTDLHRAGLPPCVEAVVLSVADVWLPPTETDSPQPESLPVEVRAARAHAAQILRKAHETAQHGAARLRAEFSGWTVHAETVADSPAWALIKRGDEWGAELMVLGAHGHGALETILIGSVPEMILHEARCSVRIARPNLSRPDAPVRMVLGMDGSPGAQAACRAIVGRGWPTGSKVRIVSVVDHRLSVADVSVTQLVESAANDLTRAGLRVTTLATEGDPKRVLIEEAADLGADCIFVGASGLARRGLFRLGTVSSAVAARAGCSVEVVRLASSGT